MRRKFWCHLYSVLILWISLSCKGNNFSSVEPMGIVLSGDTVNFTEIGRIERGKLVVNKKIDLHGGTCFLPNEITLDLRKGTISNGCLVGNKTKLLCNAKVFNKVKIQGEWQIPVIKSSYFTDLSYKNALQDVVALAHESITNRIILSPGDYYVSVDKNGGSAIVLPSNTSLELNGTVHLIPNKHRISYIILVKGKNICIKGKGQIIGDKMTHLGGSGEWGMGINIVKASKVRIQGLIINNCWGDCIYVGGESRYVLIEHCTLDNGRRQGISITSGNDISIKKCKIKNVSGTAPQYAIDIEPNEGDACDNIRIDQVEMTNCKGGIQVYGRAKNAHIGSVIIRNCKMQGMAFVPLRIEKCENLEFRGNVVIDFKTNEYKLCKDVRFVKENNNTIKSYKQKK